MIINRCWNCMEDLGDKEICPHCGFDFKKQNTLPHVLKPNTILHGRYLVGNMLGQGGFGITYIGFDLTLEMKVAIKEYFPIQMAARNSEKSCSLSWNSAELLDEGYRRGCAQFLSEARKMAKINAIPEIVGVRDTFEENKTAYIVMDYVPGITLKDYVRKNGPFSFADCVEVLLPLIDGLDKVHRQGIIHRDISPDNLMITPNGKVYLLDLGAAKDMKDTSGHSEQVAKKGFSPVEQYTGNGRIGAWTDVYAMAASIYYCVYGKVVPPAIDRLENDTLTFSGKTKKKLTPAQIAVLKKGLAVKQELRYQTAMDFYIALRDSVKKKTSLGKKIMTAAACVAAAACVIGAAAWYLMGNKPWLPTVEEYGGGGAYLNEKFAKIDSEWEYFTDLESNLIAVSYDNDDKTFYVDSGDVIYQQNDALYGDGIGCLRVIGDKLYAVYFGGEDKSDFLISMNHDGSEQETLLEFPHDHSAPLYVELSNGEVYFYFFMDDGSEEEETHCYIHRYNLQDGTTEQLIPEEVGWCTPYGQYLYYTVWEEDSSNYILKRATLAGEKAERLDGTLGVYNGFVSDGQLYLMQWTNEKGVYSPGIVACNADGQPIEKGKGVFSVDLLNATWTVGDGWLFYWLPDTDVLCRIRLNGTENSQILQGYQYHDLSYDRGDLYFKDGFTDEEDVFHPYQAYVAGSNGSYVVSCGFEPTSHMTTDNGLQYTIQDGEAKLTGYAGTKADVVVPLEINGYPVNDGVNWDTFAFEHLTREEVTFYAPMRESELSYKKTADGITITGYAGTQTGTIDHVAIPTEIDGLPVIRIDDEAFSGCTFTCVYLPEKLEEIGEKAFYECGSLTHVVFPDTLKKIEYSAFGRCSFADQEIVLPDGVERLGTSILMDCTPKSVYIPASVKNVSAGFMAGCGGEYIVDPNNTNWQSKNGVIFTKSGKTLVAFPYYQTGSYVVPSGVTKIAASSFHACHIEKIILPKGLTKIDTAAFRYCRQLSSIEIPKTVTSIGKQAFADTALTTVTIRWASNEEDSFDEGVTIRYYDSKS